MIYCFNTTMTNIMKKCFQFNLLKQDFFVPKRITNDRFKTNASQHGKKTLPKDLIPRI